MCKLSLVQSSSSDFGGFQTRSSYKHRWTKANADTLLAFQKPAPKAQEKADGLSFGQETSVWPISTNDHRKPTKWAAFWQTLRPSALRNPKLVPVRRPNLTNFKAFLRLGVECRTVSFLLNLQNLWIFEANVFKETMAESDSGCLREGVYFLYHIVFRLCEKCVYWQNA